MNKDNTYNLSTAAAEKYESQKVPSVFGPLAKATLEAISLPENAHVIDIACGTGVICKLLAEHLPGTGRIVGTDLNPAMIEVARLTMPDSKHRVEWYACDVTELPFENEEFDIAFCQQGLQFFPDKSKALAEIGRTLIHGGRFILTCWRTMSPLFQAIADSLSERVSEKSAKQAIAPFSFRDGDVIASLLTGANFRIKDVSSVVVQRHFESPRSSIRKELLASPYEQELVETGDETIDAVVADVCSALTDYQQGGSLVIPQEAHLFQTENAAADQENRRVR